MNFVTGATGHLGNVLVRELIGRGEKVRILLRPGESLQSLQGMVVEVIVGDILDRAALRQAMQGIKTVFHLAGVIAIRPGMEALMNSVNIDGARIVAEIALEQNVEKMVHVSSVHAFRREPHGVIIDENTPLALEAPMGSYDRTKAEGTKAVLDLVAKGLDAVIACPSGIIGSHDYLGSEMGRALACFANRRPNILIEGAFDFVDERDVARGLILDRDRGTRGEIYILSGSRVTLENLHQMVQDSANVRSRKLKVPIKLAMFAVMLIQRFFHWLRIKTHYTVYSLQTLIDNSAFSSEKALRELGYQPRPLGEAVGDFLAWFNIQKKTVRKKVERKAAAARPAKALRNSGKP